MNTQSDFYQILNVKKNASKEEIKQSYKKLVLKYHPDKNRSKNAPEMFRKIQIAYETLSNETKRKQYDSFDSMNNANGLKNIFMMYQELIVEICEKYELTNEEKEEIIGLFDPKDFEEELNRNDINAANNKLSYKIFEYIPRFMARRTFNNYPFLKSTLGYISSWVFG